MCSAGLWSGLSGGIAFGQRAPVTTSGLTTTWHSPSTGTRGSSAKSAAPSSCRNCSRAPRDPDRPDLKHSALAATSLPRSRTNRSRPSCPGRDAPRSAVRQRVQRGFGVLQLPGMGFPHFVDFRAHRRSHRDSGLLLRRVTSLPKGHRQTERSSRMPRGGPRKCRRPWPCTRTTRSTHPPAAGRHG